MMNDSAEKKIKLLNDISTDDHIQTQKIIESFEKGFELVENMQ
jgi:hypothetical protein